MAGKGLVLNKSAGRVNMFPSMHGETIQRRSLTAIVRAPTNMIVPFFMLLISVVVFAAIGALLLKNLKRPPPTKVTMIVFIAFADLGALLYGTLYGALFADANNMLTGTSTVLILLVGLPLSGTVFGWIGAQSVYWAYQKFNKRSDAAP
jgi:hypothetical protein